MFSRFFRIAFTLCLFLFTVQMGLSDVIAETDSPSLAQMADAMLHTLGRILS